MEKFHCPCSGRRPPRARDGNVIIRTQTDQYAQKEVIREDKEDMDMEEEGEGGEIPPPQLTYLPEKKK